MRVQEKQVNNLVLELHRLNEELTKDRAVITELLRFLVSMISLSLNMPEFLDEPEFIKTLQDTEKLLKGKDISISNIVKNFFSYKPAIQRSNLTLSPKLIASDIKYLLRKGNTNFSGYNLSKLDLRKYNFSNCQMIGVNLDESQIVPDYFKKANLTAAIVPIEYKNQFPSSTILTAVMFGCEEEKEKSLELKYSKKSNSNAASLTSLTFDVSTEEKLTSHKYDLDPAIHGKYKVRCGKTYSFTAWNLELKLEKNSIKSNENNPFLIDMAIPLPDFETYAQKILDLIKQMQSQESTRADIFCLQNTGWLFNSIIKYNNKFDKLFLESMQSKPQDQFEIVLGLNKTMAIIYNKSILKLVSTACADADSEEFKFEKINTLSVTYETKTDINQNLIEHIVVHNYCFNPDSKATQINKAMLCAYTKSLPFGEQEDPLIAHHIFAAEFYRTMEPPKISFLQMQGLIDSLRVKINYTQGIFFCDSKGKRVKSIVKEATHLLVDSKTRKKFESKKEKLDQSIRSFISWLEDTPLTGKIINQKHIFMPLATIDQQKGGIFQKKLNSNTGIKSGLDIRPAAAYGISILGRNSGIFQIIFNPCKNKKQASDLKSTYRDLEGWVRDKKIAGIQFIKDSSQNQSVLRVNIYVPSLVSEIIEFLGSRKQLFDKVRHLPIASKIQKEITGFQFFSFEALDSRQMNFRIFFLGSHEDMLKKFYGELFPLTKNNDFLNKISLKFRKNETRISLTISLKKLGEKDLEKCLTVIHKNLLDVTSRYKPSLFSMLHSNSLFFIGRTDLSKIKPPETSEQSFELKVIAEEKLKKTDLPSSTLSNLSDNSDNKSVSSVCLEDISDSLETPVLNRGFSRARFNYHVGESKFKIFGKKFNSEPSEDIELDTYNSSGIEDFENCESTSKNNKLKNFG